MNTVDPQQSPLDPDTGLPQEPATQGDEQTLDPVGDDVRDEVADGDALAEPDFALDDPPRGADDNA